MTQPEPIAVVGISAIMPDAPTGEAFWANIRGGRYSISDVPPDRWDPELFYDPDPHSPEDKTYSRIGGWVREFPWEPMQWMLPIPPSVAAHFDQGQMWSVSAARSALISAGWPNWGVDSDRVAVILGSALGGDKYVRTTLRIAYPEFDQQLSRSPAFAALPTDVQATIRAEARELFLADLPTITEDTMPGELANILAGRVAALLNLRGPNFTTDAACASALAGMSAAIGGLQAHQYDAVVTGGVDRNMSPGAFVRFCKIGALSATGTRPFDAGADGFVMGEGAALFVLKRLSDAEAAGDHVFAVILGIGGSSDGKGKGITAPNPVGQKLAIGRAWASAGVDPATVGMIEAHGTSTRVGDATELGSLEAVFAAHGAAPGSIALGSVKSNIGHLKAAAGAAGVFKAIMSLNDRVLPPSLNFNDPNPNVDWAATPFRVNTELREWTHAGPDPRRAGVSAFGFGGTNFHIVLEEYVPGRHRAPEAARSFAGAEITATVPAAVARKAPLRGAAVLGGRDDADVVAQLTSLAAEAAAGRAPAPAAPDPAVAGAAVRVAIDFADAADLAKKADKAVQAFGAGNPAMWKLLRSQGVFVGRGPAPKVAFLFTGQGSQYVNMLSQLREREPIVRGVYDEADRVLTPLLGKPLSEYVFSASDDAETVARLNAQLLQTEITQPAVLTTDTAMAQLLAAYGITPDLVMGHSLGEYGALVASGALSFDAALEAVSARGREMTHVSQADNGAMAAVFGPLSEIERMVSEADGYVVVANINSNTQAVIGGATAAVEAAVASFQAAGLTAIRIPVSHAFHTEIVAGASEPLKVAMRRLDVRGPQLPIVANVTGELYPPNADTETMLEILGRQIAEPVQFVKGLHTLYDAGARVFVEVGPKKALHGFVEEVLCSEHDDVLALFTNHPKLGDIASFNQALCGLYAAGLGFAPVSAPASVPLPAATTPVPTPTAAPPTRPTTQRTPMTTVRYEELGRLFAGVLEQGLQMYSGAPATTAAGDAAMPASSSPVTITGAALGLPGVDRVFDDENIARILDGQQFIDVIPHRFREAIVDKRITRLVKIAGQDPVFETIEDESGVIKLAGRGAPLDVVAEFGVEAARDAALDRTTRLALGAGFDALRDAGIPLVMRYRETTLGTMLPDRWGLPESMRDDTGVVFASAFPGYGEFAGDIEKYMTDRGRRDQLMALEAVRGRMTGQEPAAAEVDRRIAELRHLLEVEHFEYDRRFIFRCLSMGHSQFAELIGARGPNTQVNAACASTTQALSLAEDWIRAGRCRRVVVVSADDVSSDVLLPWVGSGFLASGAAATEDIVADVATPFDRRRHGMVVGMGAAAMVVESAEAAAERGLQPICEVLASETANSAFHGTRLDVDHVGQVMERLVRTAERRGIDRMQIAPHTVFVSHETYTPARGGSAAAEINALRRVFGAAAESIVITNTKGFTGHAMGAGIEDVVAIKALETGIVPPVPNYKEPDPDLGTLNLSLGGAYPVEYALRLAAGFGSQIAMSLVRWTPMPDGRRRAPNELGYAYRIIDPAAWDRWLAEASGHPGAILEVDHRRLRVVDTGAPAPTSIKPVEAAATPAPVVAPVAPAAPAAPAVDPLVAEVVGIVAEMTGYPPELLDVDLDLEADLGVDTVKQAEVFAAVREKYGVERDDTVALRDFPTLTHVIGWVREKTGIQAVPATAPAAVAPMTTAPVAVATAVVAAPAAADEVTDAVVAIVAEMTGYPAELLDLDLDLEADLGVDTVKQAEVFAAVRERFDVERDENLQLRDFPTLTHVIGWVREKTGIQPASATAPVTSAPASAPAPASVPGATFVGDFAAVDALPRRIPVPALRAAFAFCRPTGVELAEGARILVVLDDAGVGAALATKLTKRGAEVLTVEAATATDDLLAQVAEWTAEKPLTGVYWLASLDDEGPLEALDLAMWREALRRRVVALHALYHQVIETAPFLVTGSRLGGFHGHDTAGATAPLGAAVVGFAKSYKKEQPGTLVKAVDFPASRKTSALADALIEETLLDPGCVEIGHVNGQRWGVGLATQAFPAADAPEPGAMELGPDSVFLITGAAGSIVSAITADLATASGGTFHLLDLAAKPDPADPDLQRYLADPDGLKKQIAEEIAARGEKATPVLIERELARFERLASALAAVDAVTAAGGTAHYHCVDMRDGDAVEAIVEQIREAHGRIDVLLHAAGLEISKGLAKKDRAEFERVFGVKADGWFNLLKAAGDMPIGATVAFSSIAGRFGNAGQTDYAAANNVLCAIASGMRRTRPDTRGIALDWTAWGGIGMATRGSIPKIMEAAGVQMLPPEAGIAWIRRELTSGPGRGEVVVAGTLGMMLSEFDDTGGIVPDTFTDVCAGAGPMVGTVVRDSVHHGLVVQTTLDPKEQPFLDDHRGDRITALLPGVMGIEGMVEAARLLGSDWVVASVEDVDFHAPLKFYRDEPRTIEIVALLRPDGDDLIAECRIEAERLLPGADAPARTTHFTGRVRLTRAAPSPQHEDPPGRQGAEVSSEDVYRMYFHGPAYQVVGAAWRDGDSSVAELASDLPANHAPGDQVVQAAPRLIELCFQAAGLWEAGREGRMALPTHVDRVVVLDPAAESGDGPLVVAARQGEDGFACTVTGPTGNVAVRLEGYRTVELPVPLPDDVRAPIRSVMAD